MDNSCQGNSLFKELINKGNISAQQEKYDIACGLYLDAAETASNDSEKLIEAGIALYKINRLGKAHGVFIQALKLKPDSIISHTHLGLIYLRTGRNSLAAEHLEKASVARPEDPDIYSSLGKAYKFQMNIEKALVAYRKAVQFGKYSSPHHYQELATLLEVANRLDEMESILDEALSIYPDDEHLILLLAKHEHRSGNENVALERLTKLRTSGLDPKISSLAYYEMGHIYDKRKLFDSAFACFQRGNDLHAEVYRNMNINKDESQQNIMAMKTLDLDTLKTRLPLITPSTNHNQVFIVGFPRSGTTLLHHILESHPLIEVLEEKPLLKALKLEIRKSEPGYPDALLSMSAATAEVLRRKYLDAVSTYGNKENTKVTIDKLPLNLIDLPLISVLFPQTKIIIALRHPCDSCLSCFMQQFNPNSSMANFLNLDDTTTYYIEIMGLLDGFLNKLPLQYHYLRYEDIVKDFEAVARKVIAFLGLDWDPAVLEYRQKAMRKEIINTPSHHQVVRPLYTGSIGRWRHYDEYLGPYKEKLEFFCEMFGYSL